ncbi:unnamed protein product [Meloidogyne enterolobii]|uniref:Uncharacterized protein n=1 Tax=Meloidogyne enterolobii TaxID=390850 RepID=A0ACB0Z723_MELEN
MAPPRPTTPRSEDGEGKPPRAFVRQCVFYEKYGGCKFGKDCFYAHNDEMTLGVRVRVYFEFFKKILGLIYKQTRVENGGAVHFTPVSVQSRTL